MVRKKAKVLFFDDNRGRGILKLLDSGKRLSIDYKNIKMEGFKILYEGQIVIVELDRDRVTVIPEEEDGNKV